jgi:hypothetical protein
MAKTVERRRVHCSIRHIDAFIVKADDGSYIVKCSLLQACGDSCPYLKDPEYKSSYRRAPEYKPK